METRKYRKRDLLLGLKYNVAECGFSTSMMVLTIVNGAIVIAFGKLVLKMTNTELAWFTALPFIAGIFQPFTSAMVMQRVNRKSAALWTAVLAAILWLIEAWLPWMITDRFWLVTWSFVIVGAICFLHSVSGVAWTGWMSDSVPAEMRGRFFGRRNFIAGIVNLMVLLAAGNYLDFFGNARLSYAVLFSAAVIFRLLGMYCLSRVPDPGVVEKVRFSTMFADYRTVIRDHNYMVLVLFSAAFGFFLNIAGPFYTVYMLDRLKFPVGMVTLFTCIATAGALMASPAWGKLSDRFGHKPVMLVGGGLWILSALMWLLTTPSRWMFLFGVFLAGGAMSAGFVLAQFNILLKLVQPEKKTTYINTFTFVTCLFAAAAPILGGHLLGFWREWQWAGLGLELTGFHLLFMVQLLPALFSLVLLFRLKEPAERSVNEVIGAMRQMREFNPILGLGFLIQRIFSPRGLMSVARSSTRAFSKTRRLAREVGEDLVEDTARLMRPPRKNGN